MLKEDLEQQFKLRPEALEMLEALHLLRREPRHGSFYYEISHDRLAEAVREKRQWRLPREVKIGLTMFVILLLFAAGLFYYFQTERILIEERHRKVAEAARAKAEHLLNYLIFDLRDKLIPLGHRGLLDEVQKQVDAYYERMGTAGETDEILRRKSVVFNNKGDLLFNRGGLKAALSTYQKGLAIRETLAARDPANIGWQTDLVISLVKIATVFEQQKPPRGKDATANYRKALDILHPLAAQNRLTAEQKGWIDIIEKRLIR